MSRSATPSKRGLFSPPTADRRTLREEAAMEWTKPEFTVVAVTLEVTAYAATK
jgi:coenzyme PQQ precursor peptide PqqA